MPDKRKKGIREHGEESRNVGIKHVLTADGANPE